MVYNCCLFWSSVQQRKYGQWGKISLQCRLYRFKMGTKRISRRHSSYQSGNRAFPTVALLTSIRSINMHYLLCQPPYLNVFIIGAVSVDSIFPSCEFSKSDYQVSLNYGENPSLWKMDRLKNVCPVTKIRCLPHWTLLQQILSALHHLPCSNSQGYWRCEILRTETF